MRYAQRIKSGSGVTILPEPLKQINKFVVGIKKLGLWNSMVCWPMRSIHNAGTGSTVYSLGGLGVYNGAMVNSPTWRTDGIVTSSSLSQTITTNTNSTLILNRGSLGHVVKPTSNFVNAYYNRWFPSAWNFIGFTGGGLFRPTLQDGTTGGSQEVSLNSPNNGLSFESKLFSWDSSQVIANLNLTQTTTVNQTRIPVFNSTSHILSEGNATNSFGIVFNTSLTRDFYLLYYTLYKRTLGIGLNLP
jgi:hypothetical protein